MITTQQRRTSRAWQQAVTQPACEFPTTPLSLLAGQLPQELRGTLYRNGSGRLERSGQRVGHWFDGDGAVLAVHFTEAGATAVYRYVQTAGYQAEAAADQFLYANYGMTAPGWLWQRWEKPLKNTANTSVLALPDRLLALWEGGPPHALDLQTLSTLGPDGLGTLGTDQSYSAHPKRDFQTGEIFNFGITVGPNAVLNLYRSDRTGKIIQHNTDSLAGFPLIHDFVLAGSYLVFFIPPVRLNWLPPMLGLCSYSDALTWHPHLGTQVLVFDRETLELISRGEAEPWYQWHLSNGFVDEAGDVVIDWVRYDDFRTNQYLQEVASGQTHTAAKSSLARLVLDPQSGRVKTRKVLLDRHCEFPSVPPHTVGQQTPVTYLSVHRNGADISRELFGAIARYEPPTDTLTVADCGENRYPSEPIYAPSPQNLEQGWVLTVVYDGNTHRSEVWVFEHDHLDSGPVCRLGLPSVVPPSFHGTWKPAYSNFHLDGL